MLRESIELGGWEVLSSSPAAAPPSARRGECLGVDPVHCPQPWVGGTVQEGTVQGGQSRGSQSQSQRCGASTPQPWISPKTSTHLQPFLHPALRDPAGEGFSPRAQGPGRFQSGSPGGGRRRACACGLWTGKPPGILGVGVRRRGLKRTLLPWALEEAMALRGGAVLAQALLNVAEPIGVPGTPEGRFAGDSAHGVPVARNFFKAEASEQINKGKGAQGEVTGNWTQAPERPPLSPHGTRCPPGRRDKACGVSRGSSLETWCPGTSLGLVTWHSLPGREGRRWAHTTLLLEP